MKLKISYNAPVVLSFAGVAGLALLLGWITDMTSTREFFTAWPRFDVPDFWNHLGLVTHIFGHANWQHFMGNFFIILLIGPLLEERYGSVFLAEMILITALVTGLTNVALFDTALIGASGIVFMMILLSSFVNYQKGEIPLTFILVAVIFLGGELADIFKQDHISQYAHIVGGLLGAGFGFAVARNKKPKGGEPPAGGATGEGGSEGSSTVALP